jgi:hypothetical protein
MTTSSPVRRRRGGDAFSVAALASGPAPSDNMLEIVIGNGPHADALQRFDPAVAVRIFQGRKEPRRDIQDFDANDVTT